MRTSKIRFLFRESHSLEVEFLSMVETSMSGGSELLWLFYLQDSRRISSHVFSMCVRVSVSYERCEIRSMCMCWRSLVCALVFSIHWKSAKPGFCPDLWSGFAPLLQRFVAPPVQVNGRQA